MNFEIRASASAPVIKKKREPFTSVSHKARLSLKYIKRPFSGTFVNTNANRIFRLSRLTMWKCTVKK